MPLQFKSEQELVSFVIGSKLPEWQRKLFKQYAEAVQVHSQGEIFYKLDTLFPNEHEASKTQRILSFESVTEASFGRAANNVNRIFKNSSYTVEASEVTIQEANEHKYDGVNLYSWFLEEWVKYALKQDANARIVIYPPEYVAKYGRPEICFIESCYIKHLSDDAVMFISEEESLIDYQLKPMSVCSEVFYDQSINQTNVREAQNRTYTPRMESVIKKYVYHAFFKGVGFYKIEQTGVGGEYDFEFFPFDQDFLPCIDAGGEKGKNNINKSFLHPFVPFGNLALLQHSQHTAVNFTFSFPRMSEIVGPCEAVGCQDGFINCETPEDLAAFGEKKRCKNCRNGWTTNQTPYKVYQKHYDPQMTDDAKYLEVDDVKYYTPDVSILDYSKNEWKNYLDMAETAVYIQQRVATGGVESAKSKEIDRDDMYSFLYRVGKCYFQRLRFVLQAKENYLVSNPTQVSVETPYSYAILSEGEAFDALKDILASTVPIMLKASQVESFINKFVSMSSPIRKFLDVLKVVDPLLYYTNQEIVAFKSGTIVTVPQYSTHVFAYPTLQNMYADDPNIFLQDTKVIAAKLTEALKVFLPEPVKDLKTTILEASQKAQQQQADNGSSNNNNNNGAGDNSQDGPISQDRLPLAIAQLSLALQRAEQTGNTQLATLLKNNMNKLLAQIQS